MKMKVIGKNLYRPVGGRIDLRKVESLVIEKEFNLHIFTMRNGKIYTLPLTLNLFFDNHMFINW